MHGPEHGSTRWYETVASRSAWHGRIQDLLPSSFLHWRSALPPIPLCSVGSALPCSTRFPESLTRATLSPLTAAILAIMPPHHFPIQTFATSGRALKPLPDFSAI